MLETNWDVIKSYIGYSLLAMVGGIFPLIPLGGIWFGFVYFLAEDKNEQIGGGATTLLVLIYAFSIGLWTTYVQRQSDRDTKAEIRRLDNRLQRLSEHDSEINRRVSELVDRLEDGELDPDDKNVDLDTFELINDTRRELENIRDKLF